MKIELNDISLTGKAHTRIQTTTVELFARHHFVQSNKKESIGAFCPKNRNDRRQSCARLSFGKKDH